MVFASVVVSGPKPVLDSISLRDSRSVIVNLSIAFCRRRAVTALVHKPGQRFAFSDELVDETREQRPKHSMYPTSYPTANQQQVAIHETSLGGNLQLKRCKSWDTYGDSLYSADTCMIKRGWSWRRA